MGEFMVGMEVYFPDKTGMYISGVVVDIIVRKTETGSGAMAILKDRNSGRMYNYCLCGCSSLAEDESYKMN